MKLISSHWRRCHQPACRLNCKLNYLVGGTEPLFKAVPFFGGMDANFLRRALLKGWGFVCTTWELSVETLSWRQRLWSELCLQDTGLIVLELLQPVSLCSCNERNVISSELHRSILSWAVEVSWLQGPTRLCSFCRIASGEPPLLRPACFTNCRSLELGDQPHGTRQTDGRASLMPPLDLGFSLGHETYWLVVWGRWCREGKIDSEWG